jgi:hypothetical protein
VGCLVVMVIVEWIIEWRELGIVDEWGRCSDFGGSDRFVNGSMGRVGGYLDRQGAYQSPE